MTDDLHNRDIVERLKETEIMLPRSGYVSVGREAAEAREAITDLRARLEAVEKERAIYYQLAVEHTKAELEAEARAEKAEAALAAAYRMGLEAGAKVCNERGIFEQQNYGLKRATQNYYRARDCIRALPVPTPAEILAQILAQIEERGE